MDCIRKMLSLLKKFRKEEEDVENLFLQNGSALLEELISFSGGTYDIPIRSYSAQELVKATNNFAGRVHASTYGYICRGTLQGRSILVKMFINFPGNPASHSDFDILAGAVRDIAVTSLMSGNRNVIKIIGCCLEFTYPALVYEDARFEILANFLDPNCDKLLSWKSRLKIAKSIASAILYLHTAFPTPIIYRILNPHNIILDHHCVPKLFDFSFVISLPPGELQVEDDLIWIPGYFDPEYQSSRFVTQKTDVYSFGVLLLVLLNGQGPICRANEGDPEHIVNYVNDHIQKDDQFKQIVDPKILKESSVNHRQLQAFINIALRCVQAKGENRPDMLDIARKILQFE
ncbi:non-functional pseudokinase ZED1 isoform X1 [Nicotiana tabacum]|uniref:Non-functional pseudokinase ZED1 isoform X1 n=1 Tax=Nicotiana tabacum TaxID=4097 RepID=A0A1S3Y2V9_TOBAC|nr:PREDICTED: non-functional pseudokinase ZED1-like isoform X1 [Nicotiana tabacum]